MIYAYIYHYRVGRIHRWAKDGRSKTLTEEMIATLVGTMRDLSAARPRRIGPRSCAPPVIVLTDGACEPEVTSIGGVIFCDGKLQVFGASIPSSLADTWKSKEDQSQVIGQAELYPLLIARLTWSESLAGRKVLYFVDNESARLAMVKAYSPVLASLKLICQALAWDYSNESSAWFARVPTASNIADAPSRMVLSKLLREMGAEVVPPVFPDGFAPDSVLG